MGKFIDLTGQKFGRLTVIERDMSVPTCKGPYWICKCDCGNTVTVKAYSLRSGITKSCGCYNREVASRTAGKDLTGQKFGRLTVMYDTGQKHLHCRVWHCKCECGKEVDVPTNSLTTGGTRSCGCLFHKELAGRRFGRLVVLHKTDKRYESNVVWHCKCDCGNEVDVPSTRLLQGTTRSCGCLLSDTVKAIHTVWKSPEEKRLINGVFHSMKQRCYNPKDENYHRYGARGIYICDEWVNDPKQFVKWALENGYKLDSDLSIDRIDNDGPYSPENCRWATVKEQSNNRSTNRMINIDGTSRTLSEWAALANIDPDDLWGESDAYVMKRLASFITERRKETIPRDVLYDPTSILKRNAQIKALNDPFLNWAYGIT